MNTEFKELFDSIDEFEYTPDRLQVIVEGVRSLLSEVEDLKNVRDSLQSQVADYKTKLLLKDQTISELASANSRLAEANAKMVTEAYMSLNKKVLADALVGMSGENGKNYGVDSNKESVSVAPNSTSSIYPPDVLDVKS